MIHMDNQRHINHDVNEPFDNDKSRSIRCSCNCSNGTYGRLSGITLN